MGMGLSHLVLFHGSNVEREEKSSRGGKHVFSGLGSNLWLHSQFSRRMLLCFVHVQYAKYAHSNSLLIYYRPSFCCKPTHVATSLFNFTITKYSQHMLQNYFKRSHTIPILKSWFFNPAEQHKLNRSPENNILGRCLRPPTKTLMLCFNLYMLEMKTN